MSTPENAEIARRWWWPFKPRHRHTWDYHSRTIGGWGVVTCTTCGYEDIY